MPRLEACRIERSCWASMARTEGANLQAGLAWATRSTDSTCRLTRRTRLTWWLALLAELGGLAFGAGPPNECFRSCACEVLVRKTVRSGQGERTTTSISSSDGIVASGRTDGSAARGAGCDSAGCDAAGRRGLTGGSMYTSLSFALDFCLAISLISTFCFRLAVPLIELVFLHSAGVSATSLSGTL